MEDNRNPIEKVFEMFADGAMNPRPYVAKPNLPVSVTTNIRPEAVELLHVIACRIGSSRANVARHIIEIGVIAAATGCGFTVGPDMTIPDSEKGNWDLTPRRFGLAHTPSEEEN